MTDRGTEFGRSEMERLRHLLRKLGEQVRAVWQDRGRRVRWLVSLTAGLLLLGTSVSIWILRSRVAALRKFQSATAGWSFPSRIYSDWIDLDPAHELPRPYLEASLLARGYRESTLPLREPGTFAGAGAELEVYLRGFPYPERSYGAARARLSFSGNLLSGVRAAPGSPRPLRIEPVLLGIYAPEPRVECTFLPLEQIPPVLRAAVLSAEDRRFFRHVGFDLRGTARALFHNLRRREGLQGGSTITQQLARSLFLGRERTLGRKLQETALAVGLELVLSKHDILEMYLNSVYLGHVGNIGVAGVAEGARVFFDKSIDDLTLPEAATLAGIIPAPNLFSPFKNPRLARARRNQVLEDLLETGGTDRGSAEWAKRQALGIHRGRLTPRLFPFFTDFARAELGKHLDPEALDHRGLSVFTSLDPVWQASADRALQAGVADVERRYGRRGPDPLEGATCILEPGTGLVRALVGGRDYRRSPFNRATQSLRQPGSAFKPIVYAAAFDQRLGDPDFTPATTVPDMPREFFTPEGPWRPRNDDGTYRERVTIAKAFAKSLNLATANLTEMIGARTVARYALKLGMQGVRPVPSIGLGTSEVSLVQLAAVYATIQNGGVRVAPEPVRLVVAPGGDVVFRVARPHVRVFHPLAAGLMVQLLRDVIDFGTGYALKTAYGFSRPAAGKTGTTDEYRDAWFVGFTPELLCGVWLGYDRPTPLGETASDTAAPVWGRIVTDVLTGFPVQRMPEPRDFDYALIDSYSGGLATPLCPSKMRVAFLRGTAPRRSCPVDHSAEWVAEPQPGPEIDESLLEPVPETADSTEEPPPEP